MRELYREADAILNVCGAQEMNEDLLQSDRILYVESDPGVEQMKIDNAKGEVPEYLKQHHSLFTFGELVGTDNFAVPTHGVKWIATGGRAEPVYRIRMATSDDGVAWRRHDRELIPPRLEPDECQASPDVFEANGRFHMFFCYRASADYRQRAGGYRIGYASSPDLVEWTRDDAKAGLDISESGWDSEMVSYPHVFEVDGAVMGRDIQETLGLAHDLDHDALRIAEVGIGQKCDARFVAQAAGSGGACGGDMGEIVGAGAFVHGGVGDEQGVPAYHHHGQTENHLTGLAVDDAQHISQCRVVVARKARHHGVGLAERH